MLWNFKLEILENTKHINQFEYLVRYPDVVVDRKNADGIRYSQKISSLLHALVRAES